MSVNHGGKKIKIKIGMTDARKTRKYQPTDIYIGRSLVVISTQASFAAEHGGGVPSPGCTAQRHAASPAAGSPPPPGRGRSPHGCQCWGPGAGWCAAGSAPSAPGCCRESGATNTHNVKLVRRDVTLRRPPPLWKHSLDWVASYCVGGCVFR